MRSVRKRFHGVVVPVVTPFTQDEALDEPAVGRILDHLLDSGVNAVLLLGTTGEGSSMASAMRVRMVEVAMESLAGKATVYVNVSRNSMAESVDEAGRFHVLGVDSVVSHVPVYYPLDAPTMRAWFERLADEVPAPLFLYNIPGTTRMSIPVETVIALSEHPNVAGIKDSEYDLERMELLLGKLGDRADFAFFVGPTAYAAQGLSLGAAGFIPGAGNLVPEICQRLQTRATLGDREAVEGLQELLSRVGDTYQASRGVARAIPLIKAGMSVLGLCGPTVLPPLCEAPEAERDAIAAVLNEVTGRVSAGA